MIRHLARVRGEAGERHANVVVAAHDALVRALDEHLGQNQLFDAENDAVDAAHAHRGAGSIRTGLYIWITRGLRTWCGSEGRPRERGRLKQRTRSSPLPCRHTRLERRGRRAKTW